jgi:beta-lactamase superfamily II metal-dependent hydrolase
VVLRVVYGRTSIVLSGDAEEEEERDMVDRYGSFLASDCLKTGHHGSITSSSRAYLEAVRPSLAVVSVGRNNRHGHPSAVVLARLASSGADVARTDEEGAVMVVSDGSSLVRPFW